MFDKSTDENEIKGYYNAIYSDIYYLLLWYKNI